MASPYSFWVCSAGPKGSLPFFEEKPWSSYSQDLNMDRDACGAWVPKYWLLASPSFTTPHSSGVPERLLNLLLGQPVNSWALLGHRASSAL
jgi:hypothetical protein